MNTEPLLLEVAATVFDELTHRGSRQILLNMDPYLVVVNSFDRAANITVTSPGNITAKDLDDLKTAFRAPAAAAWNIIQLPWQKTTNQASLTFVMP